jgi:hypothetical protein
MTHIVALCCNIEGFSLNISMHQSQLSIIKCNKNKELILAVTKLLLGKYLFQIDSVYQQKKEASILTLCILSDILKDF